MKEKKMTYSFFVSFPGGETEAGEGEEIFVRLGKQLIEKGLKGKEIREKSAEESKKKC